MSPIGGALKGVYGYRGSGHIKNEGTSTHTGDL